MEYFERPSLLSTSLTAIDVALAPFKLQLEVLGH